MRIVLLGLLLLGLLGCGPDEPGATSATTGKYAMPIPPVRVSGSATVVPEAVRRVPADRVDASALPPGQPSEVWDAPDLRLLQMFVVVRPCENAGVEVVSESDTEVRLRLLVIRPRSFGTPPCRPAAASVPVTAWLDEPLGDRMVIVRLRADRG
ncbi:MAG: hypothetical protein ABW215_13350 [Kibdelosporangium sp.]